MDCLRRGKLWLKRHRVTPGLALPWSVRLRVTRSLLQWPRAFLSSDDGSCAFWAPKLCSHPKRSAALACTTRQKSWLRTMVGFLPVSLKTAPMPIFTSRLQQGRYWPTSQERHSITGLRVMELVGPLPVWRALCAENGLIVRLCYQSLITRLC